MASIEELMKSVNKKSLFGHVSSDYIQTAKSERKEQEKRIREQVKQRDADQRKIQEEDERRQREDSEFATREYEEYMKMYRNGGIFQTSNRIYQNEQHVKHLMNQSRGSGIYSNKVQSEIWQPGSSNKYRKCVSPNFTSLPVGEYSQVQSPDLPYTHLESPEPSIEDPEAHSEPDVTPPKDTTVKTVTRPRRSRVAANFTNKIPEEGVEKATAPRYSSWRDAPSTVSIGDLRPDRRVIGQINNHLSSARDEFQLCTADFPPIGHKNDVQGENSCGLCHLSRELTETCLHDQQADSLSSS